MAFRTSVRYHTTRRLGPWAGSTDRQRGVGESSPLSRANLTSWANSRRSLSLPRIIISCLVTGRHGKQFREGRYWTRRDCRRTPCRHVLFYSPRKCYWPCQLLKDLIQLSEKLFLYSLRHIFNECSASQGLFSMREERASTAFAFNPQCIALVTCTDVVRFLQAFAAVSQCCRS